MPVKNVCKCPHPPGGSIECEPHQMAICGVINGVVRRECLDPPDFRDTENLANWALGKITGQVRGEESESIFKDEELRNLKHGFFRRPNGEQVKFTFPEGLKQAVMGEINAQAQMHDYWSSN